MHKWRWLLGRLASKLWARATIFCLIGIGTALLALLLRDFIPADISHKVGADSVAPILHIIASSMLAVATFSLGIMVSAYSAASNSATPRATALLLQDSTAQNALSTFIGSFLYSLVGIIALNMGVYGDSGRVVLFAVTLVVILIIVAVLLRWVDHLSRLGRVGDTIDLVEAATATALKERIEQPYLGGVLLSDHRPDGRHMPVTHPDIGYIQYIDMHALSDLAENVQCEIFVHMLPGAFNHSQSPLAYSSTALNEAQQESMRKAFVIGGERSFSQDPRYGMIVLSEIASRALSPAVNDPGTAIDVIGTSVRLFMPWAKRTRGDVKPLFPRLHVPRIETMEMFDDIFNAIARDGAGLVEVGIRLQKAFGALAAAGDDECTDASKAHSALALMRAEYDLKLEEDKARLKLVTLDSITV